MHWLQRSPGDAGGAPPVAEPENQDSTPTADTGEPGGGDDKGGSKPAELTPAQQIETLTKERDSLTSEKKGLATKLGEQSKHIGTLKKLHEQIAKNPKQLIESIAKSGKLGKVNFGDAPIDLGKTLADGSPEDQATAIADSQDRVATELEQRLAPAIDTINEQLLAGKYADFDETADNRNNVQLAHQSGQLQDKELYYLAARGMNVQAAMDEAKKVGVAEYIESLQAKGKGQIAGGSPGGKPKSSASEANQGIENVLGDLGGFD